MDDYVSKPLRPEELSNAMDKTSDASDGGESFDRTRALAQVDGDIELLGDLFALLRRDAPAYLAAIADGISTDDRMAIRRGAHALRGAMVNFAANEACDVATEIEGFGDDATREQLSETLKRLEREVGRLIADIGAMLEEKKREG